MYQEVVRNEPSSYWNRNTLWARNSHPLYLITRQDNSVNRGSRQRATKREQENEKKMGKEIGKRKRQSNRERDKCMLQYNAKK